MLKGLGIEKSNARIFWIIKLREGLPNLMRVSLIFDRS